MQRPFWQTKPSGQSASIEQAASADLARRSLRAFLIPPKLIYEINARGKSETRVPAIVAATVAAFIVLPP